MENQNSNNIKNLLKQNSIKNFVSINDLRDKEYNNTLLTHDERIALKNFDRFRVKCLSQKKSEKEFHNTYQQLQVMANLSSFKEFLKEEYYG
ncbi:MAG: hypothetical protein P1U41_04720 [Vicingaceae bacterium]|nr:hypothetical protein [Vicingaceae bacterium]